MARRRRRQKKSGGGWGLALVALLLVVVVAGFVAVRVRAAREARAAEDAERAAQRRATAEELEANPFGERTAAELGEADPFAGSGIEPLDESSWDPAVKLAARAEAMYEKAVAAKLEGDRGLLVQQGRAAIEQFQEALAATLELEEALIARYGNRHARTREVVRTRDDWYDRVLWLKKSALH